MHPISFPQRLESALPDESRILLKEKDPDFFAHGVSVAAFRQLDEGKLREATELFAYLSNGAFDPVLRESSRRQLSALQGFGSFGFQVEQAVRMFDAGAVHPSGIAAFALGGLAFGAGRSLAWRALAGRSAAWWSRSRGATALAWGGGLAAEIPVWHSSRRLFFGKAERHSSSSQAQEFLFSGMMLGLLRSTQAAAKIFRTSPEAAAFGGILLSQKMGRSFGLAPDKNNQAILLDSVGIFLSAQAAARLTPRFVHRWTAELALRHPVASGGPKTQMDWQAVPAVAGKPSASTAWFGRSGRETPALSKMFNQNNGESGGSRNEAPRLPTAEQSRDLRNRYLDRLRAPRAQENYAKLIVNFALATPFRQAHFHERLLEAYSRAANRGSSRQLRTARAIEYLFDHDAAAMSTGSFDNALLQILIERVLSLPDSIRHPAMQEVLEAMESGLFRSKIESFALRYGADEAWAYPGASWWNRARRTQFAQARHDEAYSTERIDQALGYAEDHPFGGLILRRLFNVFAARDIASKVEELRPPQFNVDGILLTLSLHQQGYNPEKMAQFFQGTRHLAHLDDPRLARKMISLYLDVHPFLTQPLGQSPLVKIYHERIESLATRKAGFAVVDLMELSQLLSDPLSLALLDAWRMGKLHVKILEDQDFKHEALAFQTSTSGIVSLYGSRRSFVEEKIVLRTLPKDFFQSWNPVYRFREMMFRLKAFRHEGEHWRHFGGRYTGVESSSEPVDIRQWDMEELTPALRQNRLVSETMANLEEQRLALRVGLGEDWEVSRRLGQNLIQYFRDRNDWMYFGEINRRSAIRAQLERD